MSKQRITESEYAIMQVLWDANKPMELGEIMKRLPENKWARNTVATLLMRLSEKGVAAYEKKGKFNMYYAAMTKEDYGAAETRSLLYKLYNGSVKNLVASLYNKRAISQDEIDSLREMLNSENKDV